MRQAVIGTKLVGIEHVGADQLAVLHFLDRQLHAVVACSRKQGVSRQIAGIAALAVYLATHILRSLQAEAVVESIFFGLPLEALEAVGHLGIAFSLVHRFQSVGDVGGDQAVRFCRSGAIHEFLRQTYAALAVHGSEVHLARMHGRHHQMGGLGQHGGIQIDVDHEQSPLGGHGIVDRIHHLLDCCTATLAHGLLDDFGTSQHSFAELLGIAGGLERIRTPGRVHHALAGYDFLVVVEFLPGWMGWTRITFLVAAHAHTAGCRDGRRRCAWR